MAASVPALDHPGLQAVVESDLHSSCVCAHHTSIARLNSLKQISI